MSTPSEQETQGSAPSLGNLFAANRESSGNSKRASKPDRKAARREKNREVRAKDYRFLCGLLLLPVIWVGYTATMTGLKNPAIPDQTQAPSKSAAEKPAAAIQAESRAVDQRKHKAQAAFLARRNAQNITSLYSSGMAAESAELASADSVASAVEMLRKGVKGGGPFKDTEFRVPGLSAERMESAIAHLSWDKETNSLVYAPKKGAEEGQKRAGGEMKSARIN